MTYEYYEKSEVEEIMFVPITPKGELARLMQKDEDTFAKLHRIQKIKMIEKGGKRISAMLCRGDPFRNQPFGREESLVCPSQ